MNKQYDIFISYRRKGGKNYARNMTSELVSRGFHPFLDFDELKDGKFDKRIMDAIESAPVFLFILSPGCLDRCVNEGDWVREEILHAVKCNRHIIPVDFDNKFPGMPTDDNFPEEVRNAIGQHQFTQIQTETLYRISIDEMVNNRIKPAIEKYWREREKNAGAQGSEIHIETDLDCYVQRFHKEMIVAKVDEENVIHLPKGKHILQFISVQNPQVNDSIKYNVEDVNDSDYIEVFLKEKAGIVSIEVEELEKIKQERDGLQKELDSQMSQLADVKNKLEQECTKAKKQVTSFEKKLSKYENECDKSNRTIVDLNKTCAEYLKQIQTYKEQIKKKDDRIQFLDKECRMLSERCDIIETKLRSNNIIECTVKGEVGLDSKTDPCSKREGKLTKQRESINVEGYSFVMIRVEAGSFMMGSLKNDAKASNNEKPQHQVTLTKSFYIGETEVTQELWNAVMGENPSIFKGNNRPADNVSWNDCQNFINKLNAKTRMNFRLPTEAEWEFAARGGNKGYVKNHKYSGGDQFENFIWYNGNSDNRTHDVKRKRKNELALYDMNGNVWEWCEDIYGYYSSTLQTNPTGSAFGDKRVIRGGSWVNSAGFCRVSCRNSYAPNDKLNCIGLRLAHSE